MTDPVNPAPAVGDAGGSTVLGSPPAGGPRTLGALFRPHAGAMARGFALLVLTNACALAVPRLVNVGIDLVEGRAVRTFAGLTPTLGLIVAVIVVLAVVGAVVRTLSRIVLFNTGRDVERLLRRDTFAHLATLEPGYFAQASVGDLMSRVTNDLTNIRLLAGFALLNAFNAVVVVVVTVPVCLLLDWRVALWSLLPFPLVIVAAQGVSRTMFRRTKEFQEATGALSSVVQESLAGQMVVRAFSQEAAVERRFGATNERVYDAAMRLARVRLLMGPLMGLMGSLSIAVALAQGGLAVVQGRMSIGDVVELNTRLLQLTWPMIALGFVVSVWQRGKASLARVNEVLAVRPSIIDGPTRRAQGALRGTITLAGLSVNVGGPTGQGEKRRVLDHVDAAVAAGTFVGVVGRNGAGKSMLLKAIARQLPVARGMVRLDDIDALDWHLTSLRQAPGGIAVVPEDGFLFSASLRDNLVFGAAAVDDAAVDAVVDLVDLRRDVTRFPDGLATLVGERGVTLSGGQRQRVALGRALLARPSILLLDDCLSAVDVETESNIIAALQRGFAAQTDTVARPTIVMVSHRLSALRTADVILGLESGRVVERGTHDGLLAGGGLYATLWGEVQRRAALAKRIATEGMAS
jgi:ATP-binding cassette subfamily B multidrug efflux pump